MLLLLPLGEANRKRRGCARKITPQPDKQAFAFTTPLGLVNPMTRTRVRLLGPCFKTGRRGHRPTRNRDAARAKHSERPLTYLPPSHFKPQFQQASLPSTETVWHEDSSSLRRVLEKCGQPPDKLHQSDLAEQKSADAQQRT